jgi:hypothetical protein
LVIERIRAMSFICCATLGHRSATSTPGTAVGIALVGPPVAVPGLGSKVSNWLGPPFMNSRMQAMPRCRNSSACSVTASFQPSAAAPAATPRRNVRRLTTPLRLVWRCMSVWSDIGLPFTAWSGIRSS